MDFFIEQIIPRMIEKKRGMENKSKQCPHCFSTNVHGAFWVRLEGRSCFPLKCEDCGKTLVMHSDLCNYCKARLACIEYEQVLFVPMFYDKITGKSIPRPFIPSQPEDTSESAPNSQPGE